MHLIKGPLEPLPEKDLPTILLRVDRRKLSKRLWRGTAEDGAEFGFELSMPLADGVAVYADDKACYRIWQEPEPVLRLSLPAKPEAAAALGWNIGNLHMLVEARDGCLLVPDDPGLRQLFARLGIAFEPSLERFLPRNFSAVPTGHTHVPKV